MNLGETTTVELASAPAATGIMLTFILATIVLLLAGAVVYAIRARDPELKEITITSNFGGVLLLATFAMGVLEIVGSAVAVYALAAEILVLVATLWVMVLLDLLRIEPSVGNDKVA